MNMKTVQRHGGNLAELARIAGCAADGITDFSISVNPLGAPDCMRNAAMREWDNIQRYPEPRAESLLAAASTCFGLPEKMLVAGNGANQLIHAIPLALKLRRAVIAAPAYGDYERACRNAGMEIINVVSAEENDFIPDVARLAEVPDESLIFIGNPGNPAGTYMEPQNIRKLALSRPNNIFVIDEAFADFSESDISILPDIPRNVIVLRSLTKFYAVAGLRIGLLAASEELVKKISPMIPDWSVNAMAIAAGVEALRNCAAFEAESRKVIAGLRARLAGQLSSIGLKVYPGAADYLLVRLPDAVPDFAEKLLKKYKMAVRDCSAFPGLDAHYFRIGLRAQDDNDRLAEAVADICMEGRGAFHIQSRCRKPALMLQGTSSDAGKSILTAALCRIMLQDGYSVAPFKAQNMSLNSYVTPDGGEIGRAQALQAEACRLDPDVRMNPILLKPSSDTGSQVVVLGKPEKNMRAREYHTAKTRYFDCVKQAYDALSDEHEIMLLEGAGSPGEINLKDSDIVNMNMARHAGSPVLIVGDIDRGGVYASFIGMNETFSGWERSLLHGFIVNKFRGDASLLSPAHDYVLQRTGKPVVGVVPYLKDLRLPAEDSMSLDFIHEMPKRDDALDVALITVDHISNFTDFAPLSHEPDIRLRHVRKPEELGSPDIIILPGSKNVMGDMESMRKSGLDKAICGCVANGAWLVGICGGLQFTGTDIHDPWKIESDGASVKGLGLLPVSTTLEKEKCLRRTESVWLGKNLSVSGYEIHHGASSSPDPRIISMTAPDGSPLGFASGRVWTTYLHGVFDNDVFRRGFIDMIRLSFGRSALGKIQVSYDMEPELNRLADTVRASLDMKKIYEIMGLG